MPQLASLTNDDEIECISALREDQTDMTEDPVRVSGTCTSVGKIWLQPLFSDRFHVLCGITWLMTHNLKGVTISDQKNFTNVSDHRGELYVFIVDHIKADSDKKITWGQTHNCKYGDKLCFPFSPLLNTQARLLFFFTFFLSGKEFGEFVLL